VLPLGSELFAVADRMRAMVAAQGKNDMLRGKILANVFFEASTRTSCSFQAAMLRLGGDVLPLNESGSSAKKGETLGDTIRCLECYADVTVLRHPLVGSAAAAAAAARKPVINAGDGVGEHPTQSLLDLYTIRDELPDHSLAGKTIALVGDLKNGRTVHSLAMLLAKYAVALQFVAPPSLQMPQHVKDEVAAISARHGTAVTFTEHEALAEVGGACDVMYVTRVQKERFATEAEYEAVKGVLVVTPATMAVARPAMALMHPLPRVGEILESVDDDPRAAYFRQMENGLYVRMALLALVMGVEGC